MSPQIAVRKELLAEELAQSLDRIPQQYHALIRRELDHLPEWVTRRHLAKAIAQALRRAQLGLLVYMVRPIVKKVIFKAFQKCWLKSSASN